MLEGFLFKNKKNGVNHIAIGIDECKSLCGSARYASQSIDPNMKRVGERMPLDKLIIAHSKICARCLPCAIKEIESDLAYRHDAEEMTRDEKPRSKKQRFLF